MALGAGTETRDHYSSTCPSTSVLRGRLLGCRQPRAHICVRVVRVCRAGTRIQVARTDVYIHHVYPAS